MHIAIIIPAYNVAPFLADCVLSVLEQTHTDWSAIIIDDGSSDATVSVARRFQDSRICLLRQPNAGVSAARNRGIAAALRHQDGGDDLPLHPRPDAVLFLDADDWLASNALRLLAATLDDAPWASVACGQYARISQDGAARRSPSPPQGDLLERLLTRNLFANGGHLLIRREAIEAAGYFRADLAYGEDWEYWARLALVGEFMPAPSPAPLLFVRERTDGAYLSQAANPTAYRLALDVMYHNAGTVDRLGMSRMAVLRRRAEAEVAWAVGRELIRHGRQNAGQRWLGRSIRNAHGLKRLTLLGLAWLRSGPFRPYRIAG